MTVTNRDTPTENRIELALMLRDLAYIRDKIDGMCKNEDEQDDRLTKVERITWAIGIVTGIVGSIVIGVAVVVIAAAVKARFGL